MKFIITTIAIAFSLHAFATEDATVTAQAPAPIEPTTNLENAPATIATPTEAQEKTTKEAARKAKKKAKKVKSQHKKQKHHKKSKKTQH